MYREEFVKKYFDRDAEMTVQPSVNTPPLIRPSYPELQAVINRPRYSPGVCNARLARRLPNWNLQGVTSNVGVSSSDHQIMSSDMIVVKSRLLSRMEDALEQFNR